MDTQLQKDVIAMQTVNDLFTKVSLITKVLVKNNSKVKNIEKDVNNIYDYVTSADSKSNEKELIAQDKEAISYLWNMSYDMGEINKNLRMIEKGLIDYRDSLKESEYKKEEANLENAKPKKKAEVEKEKQESIISLFKDLVTNPAVIAAFSGIVYTILPKDVKERMNAFFSGFVKGSDGVQRELSTFEKSVRLAGVGIATYLGAAILQSVAEAITVTTALIIASRKKFKNLTKGDIGKKVLGIASNPFVLGGAIGASMALYSEKEEKGEAEGRPISSQLPMITPGAVPQQKADYTATGSRPTGGIGLKPYGEVKLRAGGSEDVVIKELEAAGLSPKAQSNIMGQVAAESGFVSRSEEIDKYSAPTLYGLYGPDQRANKVRFNSMQEAEELVKRGPEAVAETIYGGRMGNTQPGDAYKYRGRGFIQLTGKDAYEKVGKAIGVDLVNNPELANRPDIAAKIVPAFYMAYKGLSARDIEDFSKVTAATGAATSTYEQRAVTSRAFLNAMQPPQPSPSAPNTGERITKSSESVEAAGTKAKVEVINNTISNGKVITQKEGPQAPLPIPSTVADRGSLDVGTVHRTPN